MVRGNTALLLITVDASNGRQGITIRWGNGEPVRDDAVLRVATRLAMEHIRRKMVKL